MTPRTRITTLVSVSVLSVVAAVSLQAIPPPSPHFEDVAELAGLRFTHVNGARGRLWYPELIGAGLALFDFDNDGDLDIYLVQGAEWAGDTATAAGAASIAPTSPTAKLFRNDLAGPSGELRFTEVTDSAGVGTRAYGMGTAVGDIDNDGDLDLYVTAYGDNALYRNDGNGRFSDITATARANDPRWSTSAAFLDYDRDGFLDLYIGNYVDFTPAGHKPCFEPAGAPDYCAPTAYRPIPDRLLRNKGDGTFEDVSERAGILRAYGNALGVAVSDFDADGWPDIYVANDATPNQLWMNQRNGTFEDQGVLSGTAYNAAGRPEGSMGIAAGDYDRDGDDDLLVTNIVGETFVLYENDGQGGFEDRRAAVGLVAPTASMTGFGTDWFDADNDGWLDVFVANGAVNLVPSLRGAANPYRMRNQLFRGGPTATGPSERGAGRPGVSLRDISAQAGPAFGVMGVGRGAAFGDVDNDGRVDVVVTNNGGPVMLLRNTTRDAGHWLRVRLVQPRANSWAIGATVSIVLPGQQRLVRRIRSGGSYLSASDLRASFGLGDVGSTVTADITWPDGTTQRVPGLAVDREHTIHRAP
ncbi:CRTAC1 family protein [Luteitalea sp.]|jgi:hypothetical protein|uniref:CRTAC1 family protein n=1 Tax=Luteitalea sp. TaxID=2004800 RepID=UPI0037CBBCD3